MKKLFFLVATLLTLALVSQHITPVHAQLVTTLIPTAADDTLTNADTASIYLSNGLGSNSAATLESNAISVRFYLKRNSGTAAGSVALQGNTATGDWKTITSDTFSNAATQYFDYNLRNSTGHLQYVQYRLYVLTSGTVVAVPKAYLLRRN